MNEPIISFKNYTFKYRAQSKPTLHDICLDIYPGEKILIAGPSGSGKSTLGSCINGLIPSQYPGTAEGSLYIDGMDASQAGIFDLSKSVGTVLQDSDGQFIALTVGEDIAFAMENDCVPQGEMISRVKEVSELVDMQEHLGNAPYALSGGQKQRVSLAGVLVDKVKILLFDEPLANLDPAAGKTTIELIDKIQKETDTTVIIIEHRLEDVLWRHVDRIILIDEGRIAADTTPDELLSSDILIEKGVREPLYITALKYAGVKITPEMKPEHIDSLLLSDGEKRRMNDWFLSVKSPSEEPEAVPLLEVDGLTFAYDEGRNAVDNISFKVYPGEMLSIVGRNGAGKSTLAKLICGFETPGSGRITLGGRDISGDNIRKRAESIGYVMQNPNQMISCNMIYDEVALGIQKLGLTEEEIRERVEKALTICGLYKFRNWPISALSYGQKKRVTIASILVMGPEIIILDEPTAGQDFRHYTEIMEFLRSLNRNGVTVILITHDMHLMLEYTKRALVFNKSHLVADTSAAEVLCTPALVEQAALKETSLFTLAERCGIEPPLDFVKRFIEYDREVRDNG